MMLSASQPAFVNPGPVSNREEDSMNLEPSQSGKQIIGIIYPPPEIRNIVDKTASFVARNGADFETRIKANEQGNSKFNFLNPTDPYHAYYQNKVKEFTDGTAVESNIPKPTPLKVQEVVKPAEFIPKDPPEEFEFTADPATINAFDLDLIRLTALFVARNGRQFLTALMNREARNYQFDFLKPQHSNFPYFTKLVEQYTKVLIPPKDMSSRLKADMTSQKGLLEDIKYRVEWERHQRRQREKIEAEAEAERMAYASIDWHDFVVVQTVDFQPTETSNLPPPCTPKDVGARILLQQRQDITAKNTQAMEIDVDSDDEKDKSDDYHSEQSSVKARDAAPQIEVDDELRDASDVIQPAPLPPKQDNVMVRRDYDPKAVREHRTKTISSENWVISPLTGEKIPADKLAEHMRFNTVDQQFFDQRQRELTEKTTEEAVHAPGMDIISNIRAFAERRTDIFGVGSRGAEQTIIGKKMGEEEVQSSVDKNIWDGHQGSVEHVTRQAAKQISIEQQIHEIHKAQGLLPDKEKERIGPHVTTSQPQQAHPTPVRHSAPPMMPRPPMSMPAMPRMINVPVMPPQVMPMPMPVLPVPTMTTGFMGGSVPGMAVVHDEPVAKKTRVEETLIDEQEFIKMHGAGPVGVVVQCPSALDKAEWNLSGQNITLTLNRTDTIGTLKQKIQEDTNLPISKQKLVYENIFVKDSNTLAFYNLMPGAVVQLQMKERGGRKK